MRKSVSLVVLAAASALLLTACAGNGDSKAKSDSKPSAGAAAAACTLGSGTASDSIKATGDQKSAPKITFDKGLKASKEQRSVLIKGTGDKTEAGRTVTIAFSAYNATSGEQLTSPLGYDATQAAPSLELGGSQQFPAFTDAIECLPVGSRVAYAAPAATAFGGTSNLSQLNLTKSDSVVFVIDIKSMQPKALAKANGAAQTPKAGFPTVKLAKSGEPTVTIPKTQTVGKTTTALEVLKKGTGTTVKSGDQVTVHYTGVNWRTGKAFDSSWESGQPVTFATNQVVTGFSKALVGQNVGSQVVAVIPPAEGYGSTGNSDAGIKGTDTLVFVVDILATSSGQ
ncbi:FKBP-type peptidyl-prolyl cis-trans isomerase [Gryllotalpicola kribbensis]|uniref:peptidylprolyl isomerase n=1 Tax=Gryllotalpicola kribbensis TaxID=993084 RepID=A0ABP8AH36_9MICO